MRGAGLGGIGVDYGTGGIRAVALAADDPVGAEGRRVAFEGPEAHAQARAWLLGEGAARGVPIVLPSGFGVPLRSVERADAATLFEVTLKRPDPTASGLGAFLAPLVGSGLAAYLIPAVKQMPTVPTHRKANRIDLGTSDKLCAAAFAVWHRADGDPARLASADFLLLEVGAGFKAWVVVSGGRIVDGIGGSAGTPGPRARGALDGEVAYLFPPAGKDAIYGGGAADLDARFGDGLGERTLWEGVLREAAMLTRFHGIERILASGRRAAEATSRLAAAGYRVEPIGGGAGEAGAFAAASGAAILADGLGGGRAAPLVAHLGLREAAGGVLSYVWTGA